jgi:NitT/TauT family transport system substrate-binding protein
MDMINQGLLFRKKEAKNVSARCRGLLGRVPECAPDRDQKFFGSFFQKRTSFFALFCLALLLASPAGAAPKTKFRIAWSIYVGWMPWPYAQESGILKKWADRYGISIEMVAFNDYVESINQYTAGALDGVAVTNMDALTVPAAGGVDTTAIIVGDYSNGNDAVILKHVTGTPAPKLADLAGKQVNLVQLSVSQYLLSRALEGAGLKETDVTLANTSDADIVAAFATSDVQAVVTWNPQVTEILKRSDAVSVFDSSKIPGEILDLMVVNTRTLQDNPNLARALAGAWYETLALMRAPGATGEAARAQMAHDSGATLQSFDHQLTTTRLFADPAEAAAFAEGPDLPATMDRVRHFSFAHGQLGQGAGSVDAIGIAFPSRPALGDPHNIKLRFDSRFMQAVAK